MNVWTRLACALSVLLALAGCQTKAVRVDAESRPATNVESARSDDGAAHYSIDGTASKLHVLVYRGGAMARLGHNHVLSTQATIGDVYLHEDLAKSRVQLTLPVASFDVDDPSARAEEGEDFAATVPPDAREGTKRNLMRTEVLDPEHFPTIELRSVRVSGSRSSPQLTMSITLKGVAREVDVPVSLTEQSSRVVASGEFAIKQSDFGMTPFSVALGALQVQDTLRIRFRLVAERRN